jgi:hypothetical protein
VTPHLGEGKEWPEITRLLEEKRRNFAASSETNLA